MINIQNKKLKKSVAKNYLIKKLKYTFLKRSHKWPTNIRKYAKHHQSPGKDKSKPQ